MKINIADILPGENTRIYADDEAFHSLISSIKQHGLLEPIGLVRTQDHGHVQYHVCYGNRRLAALKALLWETLELGRDAIIIDDPHEGTIDEQKFTLLNLVENKNREDVTLAEEGRSILLLHEKYNMSFGAIAASLSYSESRIEHAYRMYKHLPEEQRRKIKWKGVSGKRDYTSISSSLARVITEEFPPVHQAEMFRIAEKERLSPGEANIILGLVKHGLDLREAVAHRVDYTIITMKFYLNTGVKKEIEAREHQPIFDVIRKCLKTGVRLPKDLFIESPKKVDAD